MHVHLPSEEMVDNMRTIRVNYYFFSHQRRTIIYAVLGSYLIWFILIKFVYAVSVYCCHC